MRGMLACIVALFLALAPVVASAQPAQTPAPSIPAAPVADTTIFGLSPGQAVSVGVGIVAGAVALDILVGGTAGTVVGALAGALVGTWWYDAYGPTLEPITRELAPAR